MTKKKISELSKLSITRGRKNGGGGGVPVDFVLIQPIH